MDETVLSFGVVQYEGANVSLGCTASMGQSVTACACTDEGLVLPEALAGTSVHANASGG